MDLQLHSELFVVQGVIWLMLASVTEPRTPTIVHRDSKEWKCVEKCDNASGMFCLGRRCIPCGLCPKDPFDLDERGYLNIYTPCIQNGFCPKVCSSYLNLQSHPLANETFCEEIDAPKVTTAQSTINMVLETTTTSSTVHGVTSVKPEAEPITTKHGVKNNDNGNEDFPVYMYIMYVIGILMLVFLLVCFVLKIWNKFSTCIKRPGSSTCSLPVTEDSQLICNYELLEIKLDETNKTATVKGLQVLNCNALQLCACLHNPDRPAQNWMLTGGVDEIQLPGVMLSHQVYTVKAGRATREEFQCIAEGKVNTEDFSNVSVTLDEECSTTIENIFTNIVLRKSLQAELAYQQCMIGIIALVFKLNEDEFKAFKGHGLLEQLYDETLTTNDVVHSSIHILMENLAKYDDEAKDFVRKIAKRDTERYCKKCLELLHRMCRGNLDESDVVINLPSDD